MTAINNLSTRDQYRAALKSAHHEYNRNLKLFHEVRRLLVEKFTGKKLTKHALNYIKSQHPTWNVSYTSSGSCTYIRVNGGDSGFTSNDEGRVCIGYSNTFPDGFDVAKFDEENCHIPSTEHAKYACETALANPSVIEAISSTIDDYLETKKKLLDMIELLPEGYELKKLAQIIKR